MEYSGLILQMVYSPVSLQPIYRGLYVATQEMRIAVKWLGKSGVAGKRKEVERIISRVGLFFGWVTRLKGMSVEREVRY